MNRQPARAAAFALALLVTVSLLAGIDRLATAQAAGDLRSMSAAPAAVAPRG